MSNEREKDRLDDSRYSEQWMHGTRKEFIDSGYTPIPEDEIEVDALKFQEATMKKIYATEGPFSYYGHRATWQDIFKPDVYKLIGRAGPRSEQTFEGIIPAIARLIKEYIQYKTGNAPQGQDIPAGCDDRGFIVRPRGPAIVTGSGPSLDTLAPIIKDWKGGLIVSAGSQASAMLKYGADPTHMLAFDAMLRYKEFKAIPYNRKKTALITHPGIDPRVNKYFRGQKYWYKIFSPNSIFYSELMRQSFNFIHSTHYPFACAASGQISFAHAMGYDPIILVGCDFSFTEESDRHTEWWKDKKGKFGRKEWRQKPLVNPIEASKGQNVNLLLRTKSGYLSHRLHLYYARTAMSVYWLDTPNLIDCSDGVLTGLLPKADINEVIRTQGACLAGTGKSRDEIRNFIAPWLASRGSFYIPMLGGHKLIDTTEWQVELPVLLSRLKQEDPTIDPEAVMAYAAEIVSRITTMDYGVNSMSVVPTQPSQHGGKLAGRHKVNPDA